MMIIIIIVCVCVCECASVISPAWCVSLGSVRLDLGLSVLFVVGLLGQVRGHGGRLHHRLEAALSLLHVLLRVEDDDVDLGDVEHAQGHGGAQAHGHRQGGGLDEHLRTDGNGELSISALLVSPNPESVRRCAS